MEELFELIVVIVIAGLGILSKSAKGKKKDKKKSASPWDDISEKIVAGLDKVNELIEEEDEKPVRKPVMPQKTAAPIVVVNQPAAPVAAVSQPVVIPEPDLIPVMASTEGQRSDEGDCDHPLHAPVEVPKPVPRLVLKPQKSAPDMEIERVEVHNSTVVPSRVTAAQLRQAVVMSEVLGKPVAIRRAARR